MNHREIIELLPWYANGTLDEEERTMVESHLAECHQCGTEMKSLAAVRRAVVEAGDHAPTLPPLALNRALAGIETYEHNQAKSQGKRPPTRFKEQITDLWNRWWQPVPVFARAAIVAQVLLMVALGAVAVYQYQHPTVIYRTASGPTSAELGATFAVSFRATATEQEIREALLAINGRIVDGPSAQGLYTVQVPTPREGVADNERVLETLRKNVRVVQFAERKQ
jgi:anti-sigma factor RsiW